jgi:hypothetical protein
MQNEYMIQGENAAGADSSSYSLDDYLLSGSLQGRTFIDVNAGRGALCLAALKLGAKRAIGLGLTRDGFVEAVAHARKLGFEAEYLRTSVEEHPTQGPWDVVICFDLIQRLRDPLGTLRYLALNTRECLFVGGPKPKRGRGSVSQHGSVSAGRKAFQRLWQPWSAIQAALLATQPIAYVEACSTLQHHQPYGFTVSALRHILDGQFRLFQSVEELRPKTKAGFLLRCSRLNIDHMVAVVGACSSGKTSLCNQMARNEFARQVGVADLSHAVRISPVRLCRGPTAEKFIDARCRAALFHYDLSRVEGLEIHDYSRDPGADLVHCAHKLDCILVAPTRETLKRQLLQSEFVRERPRESYHQRYLELYDRPGYLTELYLDWIRFCESILPTRFLLYTEEGNSRAMVPVTSGDARSRIKSLYG